MESVKELLKYLLIKGNEYILGLGISIPLIVETLLIILSIFTFKKIFSGIIFKGIIHYIDSLLEDKFQDETLDNVSKLIKPINLFFTITMIHLFVKNLLFFIPYYHIFFYILYLTVFSWASVIVIDTIFSIYLYHKEEIKRSELITVSSKFIKFFIIVCLFIVFLKALGLNVTTLIASLGIIGMAVALAAKDTLSNLFGSLSILMDNPFSQKDWIKTKNVEGTVVEIGLRSTTIRSFDNSLITIPNSELANGHIQNWDRRTIGRRIKLNFGISFNSTKKDLKKALKDIEKMLNKHPGVANNESKKTYYNRRSTDIVLSEEKRDTNIIAIEDKEGIKDTILVNLIEPSATCLNIMVYAFSRTTDWKEWLNVQEDIIFSVIDICKKNNLEFVFPTQPSTQEVIIDNTNLSQNMQTVPVSKEHQATPA